MPGDQLLTIKEACGRLRVGDDTLLKWRRQGRIKTVKMSGKFVRIPLSEVERIIAQMTDETVDEEDWDGE